MTPEQDFTDSELADMVANANTTTNKPSQGFKFDLGNDVVGEISMFKGRPWVAMRRWFRADDGNWYRTKNGLNVDLDAFKLFVSRFEQFKAFVEDAVEDLTNKPSDGTDA